MYDSKIKLKKTYKCLPICDGHIEIYEEVMDKEQDWKEHERDIYVCSKGEKCPLINLRKETDNLETKMSQIDACLPTHSRDQQIMSPKEFEEYKKGAHIV